MFPDMCSWLSEICHCMEALIWGINMLTSKKIFYNSLHSFLCFGCALKHLQTHWPNVILVELQAQIHHDSPLDLQHGRVLFKFHFLGKVHTFVLPNCLPGRKCSQETWEQNIVECFTHSTLWRARVECDLYVYISISMSPDMQVTPFTFLDPPWLYSCYEQSEWNWSSLSFSVGVWPGSLQATMTSCAVSAALSALRMHSTLCLVLLSGDAGVFSHLLDLNI